MGRKHRSSSLGGAPPKQHASPASVALCSSFNSPAGSSHAVPDDIAACAALAERFVHGGDLGGRTALHRSIATAASPPSSGEDDGEEARMDGLFLVKALPSRMRELDAADVARSGAQKACGGGSKPQATPSHFRRMMLAQDDESGYTPLHLAILKRDLTTLLLLLEQASSREGGDDGSKSQTLHPLRLLDGNLTGGEGHQFGIVNDLASTSDHEGLTPSQLLGRTSEGELERCRRTLQWKSLRRGWRGQQRGRGQGQQAGVLASSSSSPDGDNPGRRRRRMISFGDERDHVSLNYDVEAEDGDGNRGRDRERERRLRGGSFGSLDEGRLVHDDEDENNNRAAADHNDLLPLEDVDFDVLANNDSTGGGVDGGSNRRPSSQPLRPSIAADDHGCEVLTFGRANHCALGVPQFAASGRMKRGDDGSPSSSTTSYKPKRVEAFALGELRRGWSSDLDRDLVVRDEIPGFGRDAVDSPAVAVAASTHHTLVATRSGRLFSFGLGKGGRLGTGDESHRPLPARVLGPLTRRIVAGVAAAENHSLCSTADGAVYAWGSNGFGQLGIPSSGPGGDGGRLSPRRVEGELRGHFVVAVAAGDRHSVALTRSGGVYCWGDNRSGQLGAFLSSGFLAGSSSASPLSQTNGRCCHLPQRVEGLWSAQPRRRAIAIAAAEFSTLVLTIPPTVVAGESSLVSLPVNTIYGWGHGSHAPLRVIFPRVGGGGTSGRTRRDEGDSGAYAVSVCINPTSIACAKYHNVAITADGRVYTWGLHSESLGIENTGPSVPQCKGLESDWATSGSRQRPRSNSQGGPSPSATISSPRLVAGMLPENGGGWAVAVSASESHTAVVTSDGHLFTWGASRGNNVLGHRGVRWQPVPRRVRRVHRAAGVAAAREHTVLLVGASFPPLPPCDRASVEGEGFREPLSLQGLVALEISRGIDLFNIVPVALVARRLNCRQLIDFCKEFLRRNLDGVLAVGNKNDFAAFLSSSMVVGTRGHERDDVFHPFLHRLAGMKSWVEDGRMLLKQYAGSIIPRPKKGKKTNREKSWPTSTHKEAEGTAPTKSRLASTHKEAEGAATTKQAIRKDVAEEGKEELPGGCQKSGRVSLVERASSEEWHRHPVPRKLFQDQIPKSAGSKLSATITPKFHCVVCGVSCPDGDSYLFHINGRKHRNRLMHARAEEEKKVAESMMAMKQMHLMECDDNGGGMTMQGNSLSAKPKSAWGTREAAPLKAEPPSERKARSKSFQDILDEERQRSCSDSVNAQGRTISTPVGTSSLLSSNANSGSAYHTTSPLIAHQKTSPVASSGPSLALSAFMQNGGKQKHNVMTSVGASWGSKPARGGSRVGWGPKPEGKTAATARQHARPNTTKSFSEIQREEELFRSNEDHMCRIDGNQWFVQKRERAASIGKIQEQERKEREMHELIEEQRQIEEEIARRSKEEHRTKKEKKGHGRNNKRGKWGQKKRKNDKSNRSSGGEKSETSQMPAVKID